MVDQQRMDNGRMDDRPWLYYKLTNEPKGSGELKKVKRQPRVIILYKLGSAWVPDALYQVSMISAI